MTFWRAHQVPALYWGIAQLVERLTLNQKAGGSSPSPSAMIEIELTDLEILFAKYVAKIRNDKDPRTSRKHSDHTDYDIHVWGLLGEFAFAKVTGLLPDLTRRLDGDDGFDFTVEGYTIDVKTRLRNITPDLLVYTHKAKADLYVLMYYRPEYPTVVQMLGYATHNRLIQSPVKFRSGTTYVVPHQELGSAQEFVSRIKEVCNGQSA